MGSRMRPWTEAVVCGSPVLPINSCACCKWLHPRVAIRLAKLAVELRSARSRERSLPNLRFLYNPDGDHCHCHTAHHVDDVVIAVVYSSGA